MRLQADNGTWASRPQLILRGPSVYDKAERVKGPRFMGEVDKMDIVEKIAQEFNLKPEQAALMLVEIGKEVKAGEVSKDEIANDLNINGYRVELAA